VEAGGGGAGVKEGGGEDGTGTALDSVAAKASPDFTDASL
jgi:hypothetical protein